MRIISQNGMDFPYEHIVVILDVCAVICRPVSDMSGRYYTLGTYKTENRAKSVFQSIHRDYENLPHMEDGQNFYNTPCFVMPEV